MKHKNPKPLEDMIEIVLIRPDDFHILRETLTRIGVPNKEHNKLFQTCYVLQKGKRRFLCHFKELFLLDGKPSNMTVTDVARRNSIINYLLERNFFTLASGETRLEPYLPRTDRNDDFTIITHEEKNRWELVPKYVIGNPKNKKPLKKKKEPALATM